MIGIEGHLPELIIIVILALIILGPGKLPQVGGALGKTIKEFRKASQEPDTTESAATTPVNAASTPSTPTATSTGNGQPVVGASKLPDQKS
jgi:sec-independent protein translocase protein TatA